MSTYGVIEEFIRAAREIKVDPSKIPLWQPIIAKYHPTFLGECGKAKEWASEIVQEWLVTCMFECDADKNEKAKKVVESLSDHSERKSHARHIDFVEARSFGLNVTQLEELDKVQTGLQDTILTIHHSYMHTFSHSPAVKIIENHANQTRILTIQN